MKIFQNSITYIIKMHLSKETEKFFVSMYINLTHTKHWDKHMLDHSYKEV